MKNLIKRKNLNYNIKDGWYCEVKKNMRPSGCNALEGETIYIAQNGYAIFAKGIISEKKIISSLNNQSIENIRKDYKAIRDYHFPSLKSIA